MQKPYIKFSIKFNKELLLKDLNHCLQVEFIDHFNVRDYTGNWKSIALRSPTGDYNNIFAYSSETEEYHDTEILSECHYFKKVINSFKCPKQAIRLLNLEPNSQIKEHIDYNLDYKDGFFRLHIPIITNDKVTFYINDIAIKLNRGECWYANFSLPHRVENSGDTERIHLVIDCIRNQWSDNFFSKQRYNISLNHDSESAYDKETTVKIINELERMNNTTSKNLIKKLRRSLQ